MYAEAKASGEIGESDDENDGWESASDSDERYVIRLCYCVYFCLCVGACVLSPCSVCVDLSLSLCACLVVI